MKLVLLHRFIFCGIMLSTFNNVCFGDENSDGIIKGQLKSPNSWTAYKQLFKTQRKAQMEAIKSMISIPSNEKQYDMLNLITQKLIEVLLEAQKVLTIANFSVNDEFPQDEKVRDSLSQVIQNAVLYGDLTLRFPTIIHRLYDRKDGVRDLIHWAFKLTEETQVTSGTSAEQTIHLASQELNFIEQAEDYVNPYREDLEIKLGEMVKEELKKKKATGKKKKGPRMSGKTEL